MKNWTTDFKFFFRESLCYCNYENLILRERVAYWFDFMPAWLAFRNAQQKERRDMLNE